MSEKNSKFAFSSEGIQKQLDDLKRKSDLFSAADSEQDLQRAHGLAQKYNSVPSLYTRPASGDQPTLFTSGHVGSAPIFDSVEAIRAEFKHLEKGLMELAAELLPSTAKEDEALLDKDNALKNGEQHGYPAHPHRPKSNNVPV